MTAPLADAADYWRTRAELIPTLQRTIAALEAEVVRLTAERDEARSDADAWHDEAHRLGREVERLRALAVGATAPTPSSLT